MKILDSTVRYLSNSPMRVSLKQAEQILIDAATDRVVLGYDTTINNSWATFRWRFVDWGQEPARIDDFYYIINGTVKRIAPTETGAGYIGWSVDLTGQPTKGTIEIVYPLGLDKTLVLYGSAISEIKTFGKFDYKGYKSLESNALTRLTKVPNYIPKHWTTIKNIFWRSTSLNDPNIGLWDVSNIQEADKAFFNCEKFNQPLPWNPVRLSSATSMFEDALIFNQNLSLWCIPLLLAEPTNFSTNAPLTVANKPKWGTCPNRSLNEFNVVLVEEFRDAYDTYHTTDCLIDSNFYSNGGESAAAGSITPNNQLTWSGGTCNITSMASGLYKETKNTNKYGLFGIAFNADLGLQINIVLQGTIYKLTRYDMFNGIHHYWTDNWLSDPTTWTQNPPYLNGPILLKILV